MLKKKLSKMERFSTWNVFSTWNAKRKKEIPTWCQRHIEIHKSFEKMLGEIRAQGQEATISPQMMHIYKKSQELVGKLSNVTYYPKFLELLQTGRVRDPESTLVVRSDQGSPIEKQYSEWHLNTALLMDVHKRTSNPKLKKQIEFLILNYLAKSATVGRAFANELYDDKLNNSLQVGAFEYLSGKEYHRESSEYQSLVQAEIDKELPHSSIQRTELMDTEEIASLLPLSFTVINTPSARKDLVKSWSEDLDKAIENHRAKQGDNWSDHFIDPPLLFDVTDLLGQYIKTNGNQKKEEVFNKKLHEVKSACQTAINDVITRKYNHLSQEEKRKLRAFLLINSKFICRTTSRGVGLLTSLNVFSEPEDYPKIKVNSFLHLKFNQDQPCNWDRLISYADSRFNSTLTGFINRTGTRLGAVNARMKFLNFLPLEKLLEHRAMQSTQITQYAASGANPIVYPNKESIIESTLFRNFKAIVSEPKFELEQPLMAILGKATLNLLKGLLDDIGDAKLAALNDNPDMRMLIQT